MSIASSLPRREAWVIGTRYYGDTPFMGFVAGLRDAGIFLADVIFKRGKLGTQLLIRIGLRYNECVRVSNRDDRVNVADIGQPFILSAYRKHSFSTARHVFHRKTQNAMEGMARDDPGLTDGSTEFTLALPVATSMLVDAGSGALTKSAILESPEGLPASSRSFVTVSVVFLVVVTIRARGWARNDRRESWDARGNNWWREGRGEGSTKQANRSPRVRGQAMHQLGLLSSANSALAASKTSGSPNLMVEPRFIAII
ncbi:hypothetical protein C8R44DRAFT_744494 [Mycena epipterygia]|nr:hypothetical protein C8R44DRAFT_744494 [Mycena epipterygia]